MTTLATPITTTHEALFVIGVIVVGLLATLYVLPAAWRWCIYGIDNTEPASESDQFRAALARRTTPEETP